MIVAALKGLVMADDVPTPEQMVPSLLHAVMWACMFGAVDAVIARKPWPVWVGALALSLTSHIVGIKWPQIKPRVGPRFASILERIASNRLYRRAIYFAIAIALLVSIGTAGYRYYHKSATVEVPQPAPQPTPPPIPISFRLGCEWGHIPIHIPAASTIHILRLYPGTLIPENAQHLLQDQGSFEDVSAEADQSMDWPRERDGKWMSRHEMEKWMKSGHDMPNPLAFKCTMTSYTSSTLDDIVTQLLIDTPDKKRHAYWVPFDPIMSGHSYTFYVVSVCSSGVIPELVQWNDFAIVRVLGEEKPRRVPLRYEKRNWPSQLIPAFGPSSFVWNGIQNCQWDQQK
jgi:hypothetical protein